MADKVAAVPKKEFSFPDALVQAYRTNERMNQYLIENLAAEAWRAPTLDRKGRDIAAIFAHMHNVRVMSLKAAKSAHVPEQLDRLKCTPEITTKAFAESARALSATLMASSNASGAVKGFKPDVVGFLGYLIAHDAHHRGQISMLARQAGHALTQKAMFGMWEWGSRSKEAGA
ncbi:MAG: DinB family protein [Acidobacteriales bacterium]|nr:DinB family protein [Terriglobales bacterium]